MWGTSALDMDAAGVRRFIPTYVGNMSKDVYSPVMVAVHPHVCGEHPGMRYIWGLGLGSSPRMWGTCVFTLMLFASMRFIPTYVGNISNLPKVILGIAVHPHVCGEHSYHVRRLIFSSGSSPRMWGTYSCCIIGCIAFRFIPTYVGNILHVICLHFTQETISISFIDAGNPLK